MPHGYRALQHWNHWLVQDFLGIHLLKTEQIALTHCLENHFGKHALIIGSPNQKQLLQNTNLLCQNLLSPLTLTKSDSFIECGLHELAIRTGAIDLAVLPHSLEFVDNPQHLLAEACRIVKPGGLIVVIGFNPYSIWGLTKSFAKHKPWFARGEFLQTYKIKKWLGLHFFAVEQNKFILYRPPLKNRQIFDQLELFETVGRRCLPGLGGIYMIIARAKVTPLTPIKTKWKQKLGNLRVTPSITGTIASYSSHIGIA